MQGVLLIKQQNLEPGSVLGTMILWTLQKHSNWDWQLSVLGFQCFRCDQEGVKELEY